MAGRRHRRAGRRRADRPGRPARRPCSQRRPRPEADGADGAGCAGRVSGHRTVGRQPRRPGQSPAGRLRGAPEGAGDEDHPKMRVGVGRLALRRAARQLPRRRLHAGAREGRRTRAPGRLPARRRRAGRGHADGQCGWPKSVGAKRRCRCPSGRWPDRITGGRCRRAVPAAELFAEMPVALLERVDG